MDLITFFKLNKTAKNRLWVFIADWEILSLNSFKQLNNISFICNGSEYQVINGLVLKVG